MRQQRFSSVALLVVFGAASVLAQGPEQLGEEFQVNSYTTNGQESPSVAVDPDGDFVVVWMSDGSYGADDSFTSVQGQRYDAAGNTAGGEFQVNTYTTSYQSSPSVALDSAGNFVVVWHSNGSYGTDTSGFSIQGQRYDAGGAPLGSQFQVNSYTINGQFQPAVAVEADGDFVVVWHSDGSYGVDNDSFSIQGQRFDASGAPLGSQFQVNSYSSSLQYRASVAVDPDGGFVVVWQSNGSYGADTSGLSIQGQRFDASGAPLGTEFQVNSYTTNYQVYPSVAVDAGGRFVVVWQSLGSYGSDDSGESVQGQRFDASGAPLGTEFQVNSYTTFYQGSPSLGLDIDGDFVVVWHSFPQDGSDFGIFGQRFGADGNVQGGEFQVNSYTTSSQSLPAVAVDADGGFVVVWRSNGSYGTDTDAFSIQGQRYARPDIFTDGFESGDTSAWSSSVP